MLLPDACLRRIRRQAFDLIAGTPAVHSLACLRSFRRQACGLFARRMQLPRNSAADGLTLLPPSSMPNLISHLRKPARGFRHGLRVRGFFAAGSSSAGRPHYFCPALLKALDSPASAAYCAIKSAHSLAGLEKQLSCRSAAAPATVLSGPHLLISPYSASSAAQTASSCPAPSCAGHKDILKAGPLCS
jgi:hypothetical protein